MGDKNGSVRKSASNGLLPCHFCGSDDVNDTALPLDDGYTFQSWVCPNCAACGPSARTAEEATKEWNRRKING